MASKVRVSVQAWQLIASFFNKFFPSFTISIHFYRIWYKNSSLAAGKFKKETIFGDHRSRTPLLGFSLEPDDAIRSYLASFAAVALAASSETRWLQTSVFCLLIFVWPPYLADDIHLVSEGHRRRLRSSAVPRTHNTFGDRSFAVAGSRAWNSLPARLRDEDITYGSFRRELKTFCFNVASGAQLRYINTLTSLPTYLPTYIV